MPAPIDNGDAGARDLGEAAQRRVAVAFTGLLAATATALLVMAPVLIPGHREATPFHQSPTTFPMVALALVALGAAWHVLHLLRGAALATDDIEEPAANWRVVLAAFAAYAGYVLLVPVLGYAASTALFIAALGALAGMGWRVPAATAAVLSCTLFAVFVWALKVWFPAAILF